MAIPTWPATLPDALLREGYQQSCADLALRTSMDSGPDKVRRRGSAGVQPVKGQVKCAKTQLAALRAFHDVTLKGGTLRFAWRDPADACAAVEFRFTAAPGWVQGGPDRFVVTLELEILP